MLLLLLLLLLHAHSKLMKDMAGSMDFLSFCFAFIVLIGGVIGYLKAGKYITNTGKLISIVSLPRK